jgi:hypothetical protein
MRALALAVALTMASPICPAAAQPRERATAQTGPAPELAGEWEGVLAIGPRKLPVLLHIGDTVTADSPTQNLFGLAGVADRKDGRWRFLFLSVNADYEVVLNKDGALEGTFNQEGQHYPVVMTRKPPP